MCFADMTKSRQERVAKMASSLSVRKHVISFSKSKMIKVSTTEIGSRENPVYHPFNSKLCDDYLKFPSLNLKINRFVDIPGETLSMNIIFATL